MDLQGAAKPAAPHILRLQLTDFRNYTGLSLTLTPGAVVLTGENGAGKTNLLEAVSLLTPGRGLRRATAAEISRLGSASGYAIHARLDGPLGEVEIATGAAGEGGIEGARRVRINGAPARSSEDLLEWLRVLWLTPAMDALFTGPAGDRRRFLDRLVLTIDPAHGRRSSDYEKAMRGRNRLLSEGARDAAWFDAIEAQMAETGTAIAAARVELVGLLAGLIDRQPDTGPFPKADIALAGSIEEAFAGQAAVDVETRFLNDLAAGRERDRAAGRTLIGPHRADLLVRHRPKGMDAASCSTGEQKALLIGLILAHARLTGEVSGLVPILLLDEIAAHLDAGRRAALFGILEELGGQTFMTGTEASLFHDLEGRAQFISVSGGEARRDA